MSFSRTNQSVVGRLSGLQRFSEVPQLFRSYPCFALKYISRTLVQDERVLSEVELLSDEGIIVVLAAPGAGKVALLESLARQLGVKANKASIFWHRSSVPSTNLLVVDALDEVAKLDPSGIDALLVKAHETGAATVIFASR